MKKLFASFALCATMTTTAQAEDLLSLYQIATQQDPALQSAQADYQANAQLLPSARGFLLPQIDLTASTTRAEVDVKATGTNTITHLPPATTHGVNLSLTQALLNFQAWYGYKQAGNLVDKSRHEYIAEQQNLIFRLTSAYFGVLKARDTVHFRSAQKKAVAQQLEQIEQKFEVGLVAITDKREAQANFDIASAALIQAENSLNEANESLKEITNTPIKRLATLKDEIPLAMPMPVKIDAWLKAAEENNLGIKVASDLYAAAENSKKVAYAKHLPAITLSANRGRTKDGTFWNDSDDVGARDNWDVSVGVSLNLFAGGTQYADAKKAAFSVDKAGYDLEKVKREAVSSTKNAYRGIISAISQSKALEQAVLSAETALDATRAANEVGTRTSVDVLDSIAVLYDVQEQYTAARHAYILNQLALKQAAGVLSVSDLEEVNALLTEKKPEKKVASASS